MTTATPQARPPQARPTPPLNGTGTNANSALQTTRHAVNANPNMLGRSDRIMPARLLHNADCEEFPITSIMKMLSRQPVCHYILLEIDDFPV